MTAQEMLSFFHSALEKISDWESRETRVAASNLLASISSFDFIVTLQAMAKLSALLVNVSRSLQAPENDIMQALDDIRLVEQTISAMRSNIDNEFGTVYSSAVELATRLQVTVRKPRTASRSVYRSNAGSNDQAVDEYYRINMFTPLLDGYVTHINERFGLVQRKCLSLIRLVPAFLGNYDDVKEAVAMYSSLSLELCKWKVNACCGASSGQTRRKPAR